MLAAQKHKVPRLRMSFAFAQRCFARDDKSEENHGRYRMTRFIATPFPLC